MIRGRRLESCFGQTFYVIGMVDVLGVPLIRARYVFGGEIDTLYQIGVSSVRDRRSDVQSHILLCGESNNLGEMSAVEEDEDRRRRRRPTRDRH